MQKEGTILYIYDAILIIYIIKQQYRGTSMEKEEVIKTTKGNEECLNIKRKLKGGSNPFWMNKDGLD
jgi:hypothetical protein